MEVLEVETTGTYEVDSKATMIEDTVTKVTMPKATHQT